MTAALILAAGAAFAATAVGDNERVYFIELDNAFGLVDGSEVKVAGVEQGTIDDFFINSDKRAVAKVKLSGELSTLGEDTICSSEPQSLIAEYFIDCIPKGPPLEEGTGSDPERSEDPDIPVEQTRQTVQQDLVQSALRQPYRERLGILIAEFGTALAGNPENLNAAIRRGAPALRQTRQVTRILAGQNRIIRDLNANSDTILAELADRREDVRSFVENALATGEASAEVRDELSANFRDLDDFLAELNPTMVELNNLARTQTPLLGDLRAAAPDLTELSEDLPAFNRAGSRSLRSLAGAARVGERALRRGRQEITALRRASRRAPSVADHLSKLLRDLDDPRRAVEEDKRAWRDTGRSRGGYSGLEGLLNYVYYQAGALNQFDQVSHLLHFSIFEIGSGPCAEYNPQQKVPAQDGGETRRIQDAHRCVSWTGPRQPEINQSIGVGPYHPSVCPDGSTNTDICDPSGSTSSSSRAVRLADDARDVRGEGAERPAPSAGDNGENGGSRGGGNGRGGGSLDRIAPGKGLDDALGVSKLGQSVRKGLAPRRANRPSAPGGGATRDLLGFLFDDR